MPEHKFLIAQSCKDVDRTTSIPAQAHEPDEKKWTGPGGDTLQLCLCPPLLTLIGAEAMDTDSGWVELSERTAPYEPLIYYFGLALLGELQPAGAMGFIYAESATHDHVAFPRRVPTVKKGLSLVRLGRVLDYIHDHLAEDLTLAELAALAHISQYHFARLFKQAMGRPLRQYIIGQRIEEAKRLLVTSHLSIAEVAVCVGFHDQSHLYRHFKRLLGVTPGRYSQTAQERTIKPQDCARVFISYPANL